MAKSSVSLAPCRARPGAALVARLAMSRVRALPGLLRGLGHADAQGSNLGPRMPLRREHLRLHLTRVDHAEAEVAVDAPAQARKPVEAGADAASAALSGAVADASMMLADTANVGVALAMAGPRNLAHVLTSEAAAGQASWAVVAATVSAGCGLGLLVIHVLENARIGLPRDRGKLRARIVRRMASVGKH